MPSRRSSPPPGKMPGQFWAYGFCSLLGAVLVVLLSPGMAATGARIGAFLRLPRAASGEACASGAVFSGRLDGPVAVTALKHVAIAWVGVVTRTHSLGKGTYTDQRCRMGAVDGLALRPDGGGREIPIAALPLDTLDYSGRVVPYRQGATPTHYQLGQMVHLSGVPEAVAARCRLDPAELGKDQWAYEEHWAPPGTHVEIAGCLAGAQIAPCAVGDVARGHLTAAGVHAIGRGYADKTMRDAALLSLVTMFFTVVSSIGAVFALR